MTDFQESSAQGTHLLSSDSLNLRLCKKILSYIGLFPADTKPKGLLAIVRNILPPFLLFTNSYAGLIGYPTLAYTSVGVDLHRCLLSAASVFVDLVLFAIYHTLLFRRQQIDRVFRAMEAMNVCSAQLRERPSDLLEGNKRWALVPLGYLLLCLASVPLTFLDIPNLYKKRKLVYEQWYPFDEKTSPTYQIMMVLTSVSHMCALPAMVSFTAMFMSLVVEATGHFRLLSHNLRHILDADRVSTAKPLANDTQDLELAASDPCINTNTTEEENCSLGESPEVQPQEEIEEVLKSCVQLHYAIISFPPTYDHGFPVSSFVEEVTALFDRFLFRYLLCTLVPTSMAIVLLIYAQELDAKNINILILVMGSNLGMVIMCWLSNHMTEESEGVRDAVYDCDWFGQSESFKRSMRIIMSRCNQPVVVRVGKFVALSMETYYAMTKLTYSYSMAVWTQYKDISKRQTEVD